MVHRITILLIIGFWLAMTGLLLVREFYPEATRLNAVPLGYVGQIVFQHEQASDLRIFSADKETGFLHIQPRNFTGTAKRSLDMNGSLVLALPGARGKRLSWAAQLELGGDFSAQRLHLDLAGQETGQHVDVVIDFARKRAVFGTRFGDQVANEASITLDAAGFSGLLQRAGIDPTMTRQLVASHSSMPRMEFGAQSSSMTIRGQKLSTFLLSLKSGGQTVFDAQISQLGQVLSANAPSLGMKFTLFNLTR